MGMVDPAPPGRPGDCTGGVAHPQAGGKEDAPWIRKTGPFYEKARTSTWHIMW